jgi:hypothetical protein
MTLRLSSLQNGSGWFASTTQPNQGFPATITPQDLAAMQAAFNAREVLVATLATEIIQAIELRVISQLLDEQRARPSDDLDAMRTDAAIDLGVVP